GQPVDLVVVEGGEAAADEPAAFAVGGGHVDLAAVDLGEAGLGRAALPVDGPGQRRGGGQGAELPADVGGVPVGGRRPDPGRERARAREVFRAVGRGGVLGDRDVE